MPASWVHPAEIFSFSTFFSNRCLMSVEWFLVPFSAPRLMIFYVYCITCSSIDFNLFLHRFWYDLLYHFLCFVNTFSVRVRNLRNRQNHWFYNEFVWFTFQENMDSDNFNDSFRNQFWDQCLMIWGIDFGTIVASLWHQILCFGVIVFGNDFWYTNATRRYSISARKSQ